jgi:hypothetical protein
MGALIAARGRFAFWRVVSVIALAFAFVATTVTPSLAVGGQTGTVSGTVVDTAGHPVSNASVSIASPSGSYQATTDTSGRFSITGVVVDTYALSISKQGYELFQQAGVTIPGDQTVALGSLTIAQRLQNIGRTSSRSVSGAFQPGQTQDSVTFSGAKVGQALGKTFNTDQTSLIASAPGTQVNVNGNLSIRGSLSTEIGLNLDGVDYTSVDHGGANQTFLNGIGSLSVNPGAGDASQSNTSGAGYINLIPKRGTRPPFGTIDLEADGGYFRHQIGFEYGFATPNNRLSDYISTTNTWYQQAYGPHGQAISDSGGTPGSNTYNNYTFLGPGYVHQHDVLNNLIYRFGKNNNQSLQLLAQSHYGSTNYDAGTQPSNIPTLLSSFYYGAYVANGGPYNNFDLVQAFGPVLPPGSVGQPSTDVNNVNYLKLEYDNNFNATTFLAARLYHVSQATTLFDPNGSFEQFGGSRTDQIDGGSRIGMNFDLNHQFGEKHLITLSGKYEVARPLFSLADQTLGFYALNGAGIVGRQDWIDFLQPANPNAPLTFPTYNPDGSIAAHGANDCPSAYLGTPIQGGCWLYYLNNTQTLPDGSANPAYHYFKNGIPRVPPNLLRSPTSPQDFWGVGLRDQIALSQAVHVDIGARYDGANNHLPSGLETGNIGGGDDQKTNVPRVFEPRLAISDQLTRNDALRASYGRSVEFVGGGELFTPIDFPYYRSIFPYFNNSAPQTVPHVLPGTDFTNVPARCGNGEGTTATGIAYRTCGSYADLMQYEQDYFYPDNGTAQPATYTNVDASYSHQFRGGISARVTPFFKRGYNVPFYGLAAFRIDPASGAIIPLSFRPFYNGVSKQTGGELYISTPDRQVGLSGFVTATYVNSLSSRPPGVSAEDTQPIIPFAVLGAGNFYRSGYDSPFVMRTGIEYKTKGGLRVAPTISYDRGYPIGVGTLTAVTINGVSLNVPETNNAASLPVSQANPAIAMQYVDPTNPGSVFNPNVYATRGTPEGPSPGAILSNPRVFTNLTLEYKKPGTRNLFGLQIVNLFDNYFSEPIVNSRYQPVATGVAGPQSGQGVLDPTLGVVNFTNAQRGFGAYNLFPNQQPLTLRFYYQRTL